MCFARGEFLSFCLTFVQLVADSDRESPVVELETHIHNVQLLLDRCTVGFDTSCLGCPGVGGTYSLRGFFLLLVEVEAPCQCTLPVQAEALPVGCCLAEPAPAGLFFSAFLIVKSCGWRLACGHSISTSLLAGISWLAVNRLCCFFPVVN